MARFLLILLLLIPLVSFGKEFKLPDTLQTRLDHLVKNYPTGFAVQIDDITSNNTIYAGNENTPLNPASVMKLISTKAAIDLLGLGFRWATDVLITGIVLNKVLIGDLYFRGSGDPTLDLPRFHKLLKKIYNMGIQSIEGNIYVDRSSFSLVPHDPSQFDEEPLRPYNAGADALPINANVFDIQFIPNQEKKTVTLISSPLNAPISNQLKLVDRPCTRWPKNPIIENQHIVFRGSYPATCGIKERQYNFLSHSLYFKNAFVSQWSALGGTLTGKILEDKTPESAQLLLTTKSEPLASALRLTNKWSSNLAARNIFLTLSAQQNKTGDLTQSRLIVENWGKGRGLNTEGLIIDNGAGLSRDGRTTASLVSEILKMAWMEPSMPEFVSSLSIPGVDGTLGKRYSLSPVEAKAHLKTGYLKGVRSIAGYLHLPEGRTLSVVIIMNHESLTKTSKTMEKLVQQLYETN
jgi:D-alanyl-D-alanine carboxypeptidase/D-alanyl-D-alanine-endopeptidase (penicillin-binding protein 4)